MKNTCPEYGNPVEVWTDKSDEVTVNFACDNQNCRSGKPPYDSPRPSQLLTADEFMARNKLTPEQRNILSPDRFA